MFLHIPLDVFVRVLRPQAVPVLKVLQEVPIYPLVLLHSHLQHALQRAVLHGPALLAVLLHQLVQQAEAQHPLQVVPLLLQQEAQPHPQAVYQRIPHNPALRQDKEMKP